MPVVMMNRPKSYQVMPFWPCSLENGKTMNVVGSSSATIA